MNATTAMPVRLRKGLTPDQQVALGAAVRDAITKARRYMAHYPPRRGLVPVRTVTLKSLKERGLVEERELAFGEFVATREGIGLAKTLGIARWRPAAAPATPRARAMILRALSMPTINICIDEESTYPGVYRRESFAEHRWIVERGYGTLVPVRRERYGLLGYQLMATEKGQRLIEATDMPVDVVLDDEEERNLRAGRLRQVIVPDERAVGVLNFQVCSSDRMRSPRDLYQRLYDPAAIMPGTEIRLIRRRDRALIATAMAGEWNRIDFWVDPYHGKGYTFDVNFEYSVEMALDNYSYRVYAPFPEDDEQVNVRPSCRDRQFARDCGFDTLMSMRDAWRSRAKSNGHGGKERIHGLLLRLAGIRVQK